MSDLLKLSIETLSSIVNVSTGFTHPMDNARAKGLLKALHDDGERLTYAEVEQLALANNWPARHATSLAELAERIRKGDRVRVEYDHDWGELTVARIKAEMEAGKPNIKLKST